MVIENDKMPLRRLEGFWRFGILSALLSCLLWMLPQDADARTWRGQVSYRGSPAVGAIVTICGESTETNNSGRFRVKVKGEQARCKILVDFANRVSAVRYTSPTSYLNLTLKNGPDGWILEIR